MPIPGCAKKVMPLVQCNVMYERCYFFGCKWIAGDVRICLKCALKVTHPSENADFDRFRRAVPLQTILVLIESSYMTSYQDDS